MVAVNEEIENIVKNIKQIKKYQQKFCLLPQVDFLMIYQNIVRSINLPLNKYKREQRHSVVREKGNMYNG